MTKQLVLPAVMLAALFAVPTRVTASDAERAQEPSKLAKALGPMLEAHRGVVTVAVKHLGTGEVFLHDADRPMPTASLIKVPVMVAAYELAERDELSLDKEIEVDEDEMVAGAGILFKHFSPGLELSLRDAIRLMIAYSDNTATNLVIDEVGIERVNELMDRLGMPGTRLNSYVFRRESSVAPELSGKYGLGVTTAAEMLGLMERLERGDAYGEREAGEGMLQEMRDHLRAAQLNDMVSAKLPGGVVVGHKTGAVSATRCDAGIIESRTGPIAYCVMTTNNTDTSWGAESEPQLLAAEIGKAVLSYFTTTDGGVEAPRVARVLRIGADGPLVAALQRTLNRHFDADNKLGVDGDFGPNTEKGVKRFQRAKKLEETGVVDAVVWKALGPLVMEDDPAPPPAQINAAVLERATQDPLTGAPVTTCKAWAIADGATGEVLWGMNENGTRDPASTTKIMTAYLVAKLAQEDPAVLEETITFSRRADNTSGSTADVRVGEKVSAHELLYGLMLPSGNDASVAFAEHFGMRFPEVADEEDTAYGRFIQAMNAAAEELGMEGTGYRNTHGLTAKGHVTTASDLVKLAHASMQMPVFREVVATRRRGVELDSIDGYARNAVWNNSNRLLRIEGFYGVKTGTTGPAGACLVAAGERGEKPLYVVVLGATSTDARYVDSRNLFRWAWKELGVE